MKIPKTKALELINSSISEFEKILTEATYDNQFDQRYKLVYDGAEALLTELFSKDEAMEFRRNVTSPVMVGGLDPARRLEDYKNHVGSCIAQLKAYRDRIQNFWKPDELKTTAEPRHALVTNKKKSSVTEKKKKMTLGKAVSSIILTTILLILYSPTIVSLVLSSRQPQEIDLSFVPHSFGNGYTHENLRTYSASATGVSGYAANVYVSLKNTDVEIGQTFMVHIEIVNKGNSLAKPYFYVFLVNNTENLVEEFPEEAMISQYFKLPGWTMRSQNGIDCLSPSPNSNLLIPRQTLITGQGDCWNGSDYKQNCEIWFQQQIADDPSQIGKWELWIFVFDETYQTSSGTTSSSINAITYTMKYFDVIPKAPPEKPDSLASLWLWSSRAASFGFVLVSIFGLFRRLSPWIDSHSTQTHGWWDRNRLVVVAAVILLVFYIVVFMMGR